MQFAELRPHTFTNRVLRNSAIAAFAVPVAHGFASTVISSEKTLSPFSVQFALTVPPNSWFLCERDKHRHANCNDRGEREYCVYAFPRQRSSVAAALSDLHRALGDGLELFL